MDTDELSVVRAITTLETEMKNVHKAMDSLVEEVRRGNENKVDRGEWLQRNTHVDDKFDRQASEISSIKAELAAKRAPWYAVAGGITGVGALALTIIMALLQAGQ